MRAVWLFTLGFVLVGNYACDTRTRLQSPPSSTVTVSPSSATVELSSTRQFSATIANSSNQAVDWSLSGTGCSETECGTITATGLYRAPDNYLPGAAVTVAASSHVDPSQMGTAAVTIHSSVTVAVDPPVQSIDIGTTRQFNAVVNGSANRAVTWSISGPGCADNGCGWINEATGLYTGPDNPPNPPSFTIQAVSVADSAKSGTGTVNVTTATNAGFVGHYAFLLNGFEASSSAVAIAGAFTSDGNGNILPGGVLDINRSTGPQTLSINAGSSYSYGGDNRGRLLLNTSVGSFSFRYAMNAPNLSAHAGRIIAFQPDDQTRLTGSGMIKKQSRVASFAGDFAFGLSGDVPAGRAAAVGRLHMDAVLQAISGAMDLNLAGRSSANPAVGGNYIVNASDTYGRQQARLNTGLTTPMNFAFYIVSQSEAFFITVDPRDPRSPDVPLLGGQALMQTGGPYLLSGPLVFYLTGLFYPGSSATIGRFVATASNFVGFMDRNADGVITPNGTFNGTITSPDSSGRGLLTQSGSPPTVHTFYMVAPNKAFLMEAAAPEVGVGFMEAQNGTGFSNASLTGNYVLGTASPATCGCTSVSGVVSPNGAGGQFVGTRDKSRAEGVFPRDSLAGTFNVTSDGRGTMTTIVPSTENSAIYVISSDKFVAIDVDPTVVYSVVTIFDR